MKKLIIIALLFVSSISFAQNMVEDTYGLYSDSIAIAGSTDAGTTWFKNKGFDKVFVQVFNGSVWFQFEVASPDLKTFDKFKLQMEGSDTTVSVIGNTNDPNAGDISVYLPLWTTSSVMSYFLDFGSGGTFGTSASPLVVRFKGVYKRNL